MKDKRDNFITYFEILNDKKLLDFLELNKTINIKKGPLFQQLLFIYFYFLRYQFVTRTEYTIVVL